MSSIVERIRAELKKSTDEKTQNSFQRFFKEEVKCYGVKTGVVGNIARKYWTEVKKMKKKEIYALCEELFSSDITEEAFIVSYWGARFKPFAASSDLAIFKKWIDRYINNWAKCDGFCNHAVGDLIMAHPQKIIELRKWAKSKNRWMKRAAAVTLIVPAKQGMFLDEAFQISSIMLEDKDDMVQKGYGWLLKEESRKHQKEVFDFVMRNKEIMPRTALRYAIELMPQNLRAKAMKK
jgi:3-methyladenine DNA glycosylase AlkD